MPQVHYRIKVDAEAFKFDGRKLCDVKAASAALNAARQRFNRATADMQISGFKTQKAAEAAKREAERICTGLPIVVAPYYSLMELLEK